MCDLTNPIFTDPDKAREHLEKLHWPDGPICRHCGNADSSRITKLTGNSTRPGVYKCNECEKPFSVTVGTAMERSKIPLNKWLLAMHLMMASKKGMRLGGFIHINPAENFYSILKRGIYGIYHHVSEAHLHRYLAEFDFRYSNRCDLGFEDTARTEKALKGLEGKRLMYRQPDRAAHA